ncbi:MAG: hypothetical protein OXR84_10510 [Magnetovibrio sp.]|nr:hypothetical protein [Magnetovibrio sp.]
MTLRAPAAAALMLAIAVGACGGRVARPVPATTPSDHLMTCTHIVAEYTTNLERATDIGREMKGQAGQNVGHFMLSGVFLLNLNDSEEQEIRALYARNQELRRLATKKNFEL